MFFKKVVGTGVSSFALRLHRIPSLRTEPRRLREPSSMKSSDAESTGCRPTGLRSLPGGAREHPSLAQPNPGRSGPPPRARVPAWECRRARGGCVPVCVRDSARVARCSRARVRVPARVCEGVRAGGSAGGWRGPRPGTSPSCSALRSGSAHTAEKSG